MPGAVHQAVRRTHAHGQHSLGRVHSPSVRRLQRKSQRAARQAGKSVAGMSMYVPPAHAHVLMYKRPHSYFRPSAHPFFRPSVRSSVHPSLRLFVNLRVRPMFPVVRYRFDGWCYRAPPSVLGCCCVPSVKVWGDAGCTSWYKTPSGKVVNNSPWKFADYWVGAQHIS